MLRIARRFGERRVALCAGVLGFACFMPYPAINVGRTSAIQIGNILTALMVLPVAGLLLRRRPFNIYPALMLPMCLSTLIVAARGGEELSLSLKFTVAFGVSCLSLWAAQLYAPRYSIELLTGIAAATVVHAIVGLWQLHSFSAAQFPLVELYVNQSFLSVQENVNVIARYIQRPFGIFPEPSAMSSSLAPWVLLWSAYFLEIIRFKREPARWQRLLFAAAAAGGLVLIILSRSGHAGVTLMAMAVLGAIWAMRTKAKPQVHLAVLAVAAIVLPFVVIMAVNALGDRMGGARIMNSSWQERSSSLLVGFGLFTNGGIGTALFGVGPGLSPPALWELARLQAVWSVLLTYVYETGLIGILVIAWIARYLLRTWRAAGRDIVFTAILGVWLVGVTITTSYGQLLPLWIALGWLTVWPSVCERVSHVRTTKAASADHGFAKPRFVTRHGALIRRGA
ncbi:MAG: hypothetical protein WBD40_25985 [Tepidisphaeraceae bacterium]